MRRLAWVAGAWLLGSTPGTAGASAPPEQPEPTAAPADGTRDPLLAQYMMQMRAAGVLDNREATLEEIETILQHAQQRYVQGDTLGSAVLLHELGHNPRYENFRELPVMSSVNYHLGVTLQAYGADKTAVAAYAEVLKLGPDDPYFTPALRRHVDIGLASKDYVDALAQLNRSLSAQGPGAGPIALQGLDLDEREYLEARALQQQGKYDAALAAYANVDTKSRFYTASRYLQGVVHARQRDFRAAEGAFCDVVGGANQSTAVYYVDRRYFPVRDLAHLGLGRVAHEELRHGHAFYHYFQVPQDSDHLPEALFEAAWTMAEEGDYPVARDLIAELRERYPDAPQSVEARLLEAMLKLYDCDFRLAEDEFTRFIDDVAPVADHIDEIRSDPGKIRALHEELSTVRRGEVERAGDLPAHRLLLSMLAEDPTYERLSHKSDVLQREADFAKATSAELARVAAQLRGQDISVARAGAGDALDAIAESEDIERGISGLERQLREAEAAGVDATALDPERDNAAALRQRVRALRQESTRLLLAGPAIGSVESDELIASVDRDVQRTQAMRASSLSLAANLDDQAASVAAGRMGTLKGRIEELVGEARMGRIDAVLGAKKKLEIEVRDMAAGKFPPELFGKLQIEGMVGDDEEFWPYEGEYWADEYEGYR